MSVKIIYEEIDEMVDALYTLKKKYRGKKIYIWNINRNSIVVFTRVFLQRVEIQGFVTLQEEYVGNMYMNRPVVALRQIEREKDSIILISDEVLETINNVLPNNKMIYWSDALEFNEELRHRKVILYGMDYLIRGKQLAAILADERVETALYCVRKKDYVGQSYKGKEVVEVTELRKYEDCAVIISVAPGRERQEILESLVNFRGQIYMEDILGEWEITNINLIQNIELAIKKHKKIYLYSKKNIISSLIEEALNLYGISINGYVYDAEEEYIKSIYSMAFEGIEDKLIIINEECPERLVKARENIEFAGFSLEKGNYTGLQWYTRAKEILLSELEDYYDPLVGFSNLYIHGKAGWKLYGKEEGGIRILVLGGSTSAENNHPENWVSKLYHKLKQKNIKVSIYNGAYPGNDIVDEILRLLRDGYVLQPHIVISMSGVNNTCYKKCANQFNEDNLIGWIKNLSSDKRYCSGVYSEESLYSFWSRNVKLLRLISQFFGAEFFGFLQPMNITMNHMTLWEKSTYEIEEHIKGARDFAQLANDGIDYINLMHLFECQDEMYFDMCHYTDKAHEIIADKVYNEIMPAIKALM